jgi:hypothetical protein
MDTKLQLIRVRSSGVLSHRVAIDDNNVLHTSKKIGERILKVPTIRK